MTEKKYIVTDHGNDKTYDITELDPNGYPIYTKPKQEIDTEKLLAEAESLIEYNRRQREQVTSTVVPKQEQKPDKQVTVKQFQKAIDDAKIMASQHKPKQIFLPENIFDY